MQKDEHAFLSKNKNTSRADSFIQFVWQFQYSMNIA